MYGAEIDSNKGPVFGEGFFRLSVEKLFQITAVVQPRQLVVFIVLSELVFHFLAVGNVKDNALQGFHIPLSVVNSLPRLKNPFPFP